MRNRMPIARSWQMGLMESFVLSVLAANRPISQFSTTDPSCLLRFSELDDDLDIVSVSVEGAFEVFRSLSSGDQPVQPRTVCPGQRFAGLIPMPLVGIHTADEDVVLQDRRSRNIAGG